MDFANTVVGCCHGFLRNYESCHCSNLSFLILFSISRELRFKKKLKRFFEIRNLVIEYCESNLRNSKFCIQIWLLKCFQYPRCDLFYRLFRIGQRTCKFEYMKFFMIFKFQYMIFLMISFNFFFKKIFKSWRSERCSWGLSEYSQGLHILPPKMAAQFFVFFAMTFFIFSIFREQYKKIKKIKNPQPWSWILWKFSQGLQILRPKATAQMLSWCDILFLRLFSKNLQNQVFPTISEETYYQGTLRRCKPRLQI